METDNPLIKEDIFKEFSSEGIISVKDNRLKILNSIDISTYGAKSWAFTLQEIALRMNEKNSNYLYKIGYVMGESSAKQMLETLQKMKSFITPKITDISNMIGIAGFGTVEVEEGNGKITVIVKKNHIISYGREMYQDKSKIYDFYRGIYSAFINLIKNNKIELKCIQDSRKEQIECAYVAE